MFNMFFLFNKLYKTVSKFDLYLSSSFLQDLYHSKFEVIVPILVSKPSEAMLKLFVKINLEFVLDNFSIA